MPQVQVITAVPLTEELRKQVQKVAAQKLGSKEFDLVEKVDPAILAGVQLIINSVSYDATLRRKLNSLRSQKGA